MKTSIMMTITMAKILCVYLLTSNFFPVVEVLTRDSGTTMSKENWYSTKDRDKWVGSIVGCPPVSGLVDVI